MNDEIRCFIDCGVPINLCNFKCEYCTVGQRKEFKDTYMPFPCSVEHISKSLSPKRFGGICAINLCGNGETFLHPDIVSLITLLLQDGHFVFAVTNGTVKKAFDELYALPSEWRERLFIKFSLHYAELLRTNMLDLFFDTVAKAKAAGLSFTVELVAADCNIPYIEKIKEVCMERLGALCHLTDARDESKEGIPRVTLMDIEQHTKLWEQFDSALFDYRQATWSQNRKGYFCNTGQWAFTMSLGNGVLRQCYKGGLQNLYEDLDEPIHFLATGRCCPYPHCFNSHVWDCFAGVIPSIQSPSYAELRNRVCADGSEWLSPRYKAVFERRISKNNKEYDENRQIFTDGIMMLVYRETEPSENFVKITKQYLNAANFLPAIIHGCGRLAQYLLTHIEGLSAFDENNEKDNENDNGVVIITEYKNVVAIKKELSKKTNSLLVNILDLPIGG